MRKLLTLNQRSSAIISGDQSLKNMFKNLHNEGGFSLMELLIYMGILGIAAGLITGIFTSVTKTQIEESIQTEISGQLNFTMQTIQRLVKNSSLVDADAGTASSTLILKMKDVQDLVDGSTNYYTKIYLSNGRIYVEEQPNSPQSITGDKVTVDSLEFKKLTQYPGKDIVQIDMAMSGATQVEGRTISRSLRSAISRVSAATFDSDLVPGSDNAYSVGTSNRWKNGSFSGNVGIGVSTLLNKLDVSGGAAIGTYAGSSSTPSNGLIVSGNVGIGITTPTAVLNLKAGTATANTAPLKFTSGPLLGTAEAGAMEFLTDVFYLTKTTGPTREQIATAPNTLTFTNKRNTPRIYTTTSIAGSPGVLTPEINTYDYFEITAQAAALNIANPSASTPTGGEKMIIAITSDATPRALTYGTAYVAKAGVALPSTTVASKTTTLGFIYNAGLAKWNLVAVGQE